MNNKTKDWANLLFEWMVELLRKYDNVLNCMDDIK